MAVEPFTPADTSAEPAWAPLCMSEAEYRAWQRTNAEAGILRARRPCQDCPADWGEEQARAGRCNGAWAWLAEV